MASPNPRGGVNSFDRDELGKWCSWFADGPLTTTSFDPPRATSLVRTTGAVVAPEQK